MKLEIQLILVLPLLLSSSICSFFSFIQQILNIHYIPALGILNESELNSVVILNKITLTPAFLSWKIMIEAHHRISERIE